jgi:zinc and cadmium transporter
MCAGPASGYNGFMQSNLTLTVYCVLVAGASLVGGLVPFWARLTHARMQCLMSFVAGLMLGVGLFHMLPHAVAEGLSLDQAVLGLVAGLLAMFFMIRFLHFHQHGPGGTVPDCEAHSPHEHHAHTHSHGEVDPPTADAACAPASIHRFSWLGIAIGLAVHTFLDGVALAASVEAESATLGVRLAGLGTLLAVALHKPLDAMSIACLLSAGGWSAGFRQAVNLAFATVVPLGAAGFYLGTSLVPVAEHLAVGWALAFSAGMFLCIALGDLLPEVEFHAHDRTKLSLLLVLGLAAAYAIGLLEGPNHGHGHAGHTHETHAGGPP